MLSSPGKIFWAVPGENKAISLAVPQKQWPQTRGGKLGRWEVQADASLPPQRPRKKRSVQCDTGVRHKQDFSIEAAGQKTSKYVGDKSRRTPFRVWDTAAPPRKEIKKNQRTLKEKKNSAKARTSTQNTTVEPSARSLAGGLRTHRWSIFLGF